MSEEKTKQLLESINKLHQLHCGSNNHDAMPKTRNPPSAVPGRSSK
jgi:hypothetical protein